MLAREGPVGRDAIAGLHPHHVAGDEQGGVELDEVVVAHDPRLGSGELPQAGQRVLGAILLPDPMAVLKTRITAIAVDSKGH